MIYQLSNELILANFYVFLLIKIIYNGSGDSENTANVCIYFIIASWILNAVIKLLMTFINLRDKIKAWIGKRRKVIELNEETHIKSSGYEKNDITFARN